MRPTALGRMLALGLVVSCLAVAGLRTLSTTESAANWFFELTSLAHLAPEEHRLVEFLLLLPVAGQVIAMFRNIVGLPSFGTFAPVLIGLAFRHLESWPGILVFVAVLLVGWAMRRLLEPLHLLEVPRASLMLSLVVVGLVGLVLVCHACQIAITNYLSLFPLVILTGIIERLWAMETEDGAWASLRTLLGTLTIAASVSLVLAIPGLVSTLVRCPELIGLCMAGQLLLGRYTGYRLTELYRFGVLLGDEPAPGARVENRTIRVDPAVKASLHTTSHHGLDVTSSLPRRK